MPNLGGATGLILVLIVLVIFAAPKLPQMAKSVAQSMNIFKSEIKTGKNEPSAADAEASTDEKQPKN
ncbi:twin-arginine translocase TatA/TatE family subunit [Salinibacterium sp. dk2585]|uniref:twin-arginine translocase TatA/TatE family subunit n=1 Tax=unclassified Salinibacterium TaxID=2632331 RepID=UPI0011C2516B|nr:MULTISPECIES: twin-arginine translocase TatA/TatE family subunit [unclassified Salinibacterium]QEE61154.1 twin-arginine translocase TatA/TatE family subunit [Salinibacterium sp. dk2585]TXK53097.1 twin-arginine translocase TatA/TatE family subunit [Salinibacterium sp. dk5596]